ncbi:MAG: hypothetical protein AAFO84_14185 [Cyanobacteria bacterium J06598_1]
MIGACLGRLSASRHWKKRLKATRQDLFAQYVGDIDAANRQRDAAERIQAQLEKKENSWRQQTKGATKREQALVRQLSAAEDRLRQQTSDHAQRLSAEQQKAHQLQADLNAQRSQQQQRYSNLETEYHDYKRDARAEVDASLKESIIVEQKNRRLTSANQQLQAKNKTLTAAAESRQHNWEEQIRAAHLDPAIDFGEIIAKLFPNIELLRDSIDEINRNKETAATLLFRIQALSRGDVSYSRKVHATSNYWSECRAPNMGMMRIYYRKSKREADKYEILISRKQNRKTQDKDIAWLKKQPR